MRKPRDKNKRNKKGEQWWQSYSVNIQTERMFEDWILTLMMNRFRWLNLPDTCDPRYLEYTLAFNGVATIAHPKRHKLKDFFFSTQAVTMGELNIYNNPEEWESFGNKDWHFNVDWNNGVLIYDNRLRRSLLPTVKLYAKRLANLERTIDMNLYQQRMPIIISAPQERKQDLLNYAKQQAGFEPMVLTYDSLQSGDYGIKAEVLNTSVPYIVPDLQLSQQNMWEDIYRLLGIPYVKEKSERLIASEVEQIAAPAKLMALDPLEARREACDKLNKRFGLNVGVVWNEDFVSDTYNFLHNTEKQAAVNKGNGNNEEEGNNGSVSSPERSDV